MDRLQEQREQQLQKQKRDTRRRDLDESLRLKLKRLAREQQEELELDMSILQHMLRQETDEKLGRAQKKVNRWTLLTICAYQCSSREKLKFRWRLKTFLWPKTLAYNSTTNLLHNLLMT